MTTTPHPGSRAPPHLAERETGEPDPQQPGLGRHARLRVPAAWAGPAHMGWSRARGTVGHEPGRDARRLGTLNPCTPPN